MEFAMFHEAGRSKWVHRKPLHDKNKNLFNNKTHVLKCDELFDGEMYAVNFEMRWKIIEHWKCQKAKYIERKNRQNNCIKVFF